MNGPSSFPLFSQHSQPSCVSCTGHPLFPPFLSPGARSYTIFFAQS